MAIIPESQYPGKITPASTDYPYGEARNITLPGDGTGTPWEAALVNDIFGFQQALLDRAEIVPSGDPETAVVSQYLDAAEKVIGGDKEQFISSIAEDLPGLTGVDGKAYRAVAFHADASTGGQPLVYDASEPKSNHGITGWSPTVPAVSAQAGANIGEQTANYVSGAGETDSGGNGLFKFDAPAELSVYRFGYVGGGFNMDVIVQAALDSADFLGVADVRLPIGGVPLAGVLQPEGVNIKGPGKRLCTIERFSGTGALIIARSDCEISGFTADGKATAAGNGDAISIDGKTRIKLRDLRLINNANDGVLCRNSSFIDSDDIETEDNFRNGGSFTDNNSDLTFGTWSSRGDAVAGLDMEPNTTTNVRIRARNIHMDNTNFGFQGNSATIFNEDIQVDFISVVNGGFIQFTKALECNVNQIEIDETSSMNIDEKVTGGFGQTTGLFSNIRWRGKATHGENLIRNGAFRDREAAWQIVTIGGGTAEVVEDSRASFYGKMLRCETFADGDSASFVQEAPAVAGDVVSFAFDLISEANRPHGIIRYKDGGGATISEVRMADLPTADSTLRRHYYMAIAPANTASVQVLLGGSFSSGGAFVGYFDAAVLRVNCTQFDYGENLPPIKVIYNDGKPSEGTFKIGDLSYNTRANIDGNNMQILAYRRLTDGSAHVINTDWAPLYASTVSPAT